MPRDGSIPSANDHSRWRYALTTRILENDVSRETEPPLLSPASSVIAERPRVTDAHRREFSAAMAFRRSSILTSGTDGGESTVSISIASRSTRAPSRCTRTPDAPTLHVDQPDGSAVVHSRSLDGRSRATVPSTSSALAHVPESSPRRFRRAPSRRSTTPRASPHRRLSGTGTSYRAGVPAAATAIERFSRPPQRSMRDCPRVASSSEGSSMSTGPLLSISESRQRRSLPTSNPTATAGCPVPRICPRPDRRHTPCAIDARCYFYGVCLERSFTAAPTSIRTPNWHRTVSRETAPAPDRLERQSKCLNLIRERTS